MTAVRPNRVVECGLEVPRGVVYQGWEPGGEYTKPLVMRNVQLRTQRIKYSIKGNQFHSAVYPRPIVLSAGMSYTLPIVFKPMKKEPCEECIELETAEGAVEVSLKALLPCVTVTLPESLKFGLCAVQDSISLDFHISNTSYVCTRFSFECSNECFTISPITGELPPKTLCKLSATFTPNLARVYSVVATCSYGKEGGEKKGIIKLRGVGKYPHVVVTLPCSSRNRGKGRKGTQRGKKGKTQFVEENMEEQGKAAVTSGTGSNRTQREVMVKFGSVAVGTSIQKWIELVNVSAVTASVSILPTNCSRLNPAHFTCPPSPPPLLPHSSHRLPLTFSPILPSQHSTFAFFEVKIRGGLAATTIKCIGSAKAPRVCIEEEVLHFGNVLCGQSVSTLLHVSNHSDVTALFQFQLERGSVFSVDSTCIKLPPHTGHKIPLHFTPRKPAPHCKRIACLVQHQEPLFVSLIGTAYSETITPVLLQPQHVTDYISNTQSGVTKLPPERVMELMKEGKLIVDENTGLLQPENADDSNRSTQGTIEEVPTLPFTNYLHSPHEPSGIAHVTIDSQDLQFGRVSPHSVSDGRSLHVTNHTEGTVCCVWMTGSGGTFSVMPEEREIAPGMTCLFTAHFKPKHPGEFYFEELECYAFYKCLRSYQSVPAAATSVVVTPPWCLCVRAQGHSFSSNTHTFTPKLVFETRDVVFPAGSPLEPVYRSMTVWNDGDTPALFEMSPDPNKIFTIRPQSGLIPHGQYQTFVMEMMPQEAKTYKHITCCALNASSDYNQDLLLSGTAEMSPVLLENQGQLFFKPTCVRASSSANLKITNTAQVPLRYEWRVSGNGSEVFTVDPREGVILPSESQTHQWQFSPWEARSLTSKAVLYTTVAREGSSSYHKRRHKSLLDLFGQGVLGDIQCHPSQLQFGTVVMGTSHTHTITLHNPSLCTLNYSLHVQHASTNDYQHHHRLLEEEFNTTSHGVKLDPCEGALHPRSSQVVRVTVRPVMTTPYRCVISYHLISTNSAVAATDRPALCELEITGAYPSLVVTDIHGIEVANGLSKAHLWKMLSIDRLNGHLQEEPCVSELRYAIGTRHSTRRRVSVHTHAIEDFHFGAAPLDSGCSVVHLVLENRGKVESQWGFQFPSDMHLEPEYWADSGVLDDVERHQHDIITNQLFTVSLKTGKLAPGQCVSVLCSFKHTHIGRSKLPVLLKIHRGREILLNWSGVTVERATPHVFFTSHHHSFHPVPIGTASYPTQTYQLHNVGEKSVTYEVDTAPLQALTSSNYHMTVLQCLCVQGEVPPRGIAALPFIFSPLEAKKYSVDVPISFSTGESVLITFSGEGLDPNTQSPPPDTHSAQLPVTGPPVTLPDQLAALSSEHLYLGSLPLFSPVRRLVFLSNLHPSHTISYNWCITSATAAEVVSIHPSEGCVLPGKSCISRVMFYSHFSPSVYDLDIICKVVDRDKMSEYQCKLEQWTRQQDEKKHMFTISHPKPGHNRTTDETEQPSTGCLRSSSNSDLRGSRYQVLPPIGAHPPDISYEDWKRLDLSIRSKTRPRARKSSADESPCPPPPLLLHLGVTAHTHSLTDYADTFGNLDTFYVSPSHEIPLQGGDGLCMKTEERDLILSVLGQITRELLNDGNFHSALARVQQEPVTYFTQFSVSPHTAATDTSPTAIHTDHTCPSSRAHSTSASATERSEAAEEKEDNLVSHDGAMGSVVSAQGEECGVARGEESRSKKLNSSSDIIERSPEVESLIESILENTLLNIVRESNAGEFNITAARYLVASHKQ